VAIGGLAVMLKNKSVVAVNTAALGRKFAGGGGVV